MTAIAGPGSNSTLTFEIANPAAITFASRINALGNDLVTWLNSYTNAHALLDTMSAAKDLWDVFQDLKDVDKATIQGLMELGSHPELGLQPEFLRSNAAIDALATSGALAMEFLGDLAIDYAVDHAVFNEETGEIAKAVWHDAALFVTTYATKTTPLGLFFEAASTALTVAEAVQAANGLIHDDNALVDSVLKEGMWDIALLEKPLPDKNINNIHAEIKSWYDQGKDLASGATRDAGYKLEIMSKLAEAKFDQIEHINDGQQEITKAVNIATAADLFGSDHVHPDHFREFADYIASKQVFDVLGWHTLG